MRHRLILIGRLLATGGIATLSWTKGQNPPGNPTPLLTPIVPKPRRHRPVWSRNLRRPHAPQAPRGTISTRCRGHSSGSRAGTAVRNGCTANSPITGRFMAG